MQNIVHETNSKIHNIEKLNDEEYNLPDLWKLKQSQTLETLLEKLQILQELEISNDDNSENCPDVEKEIVSKPKKNRKKEKTKKIEVLPEPIMVDPICEYIEENGQEDFHDIGIVCNIQSCQNTVFMFFRGCHIALLRKFLIENEMGSF